MLSTETVPGTYRGLTIISSSTCSFGYCWQVIRADYLGYFSGEEGALSIPGLPVI